MYELAGLLSDRTIVFAAGTAVCPGISPIACLTGPTRPDADALRAPQARVAVLRGGGTLGMLVLLAPALHHYRPFARVRAAVTAARHERSRMPARAIASGAGGASTSGSVPGRAHRGQQR